VRPGERVVDPLTARGLILLTDKKPIVLCSVDWVAISNGAHDAWCEALAEAVGASPDRVSVHVVHQHDAPGVDFTAEEILAAHGHRGLMYDDASAREAIRRVAKSASAAMKTAAAVSHVGFGKGKVEKFASNRRVVDEAGKFLFQRQSKSRDPAAWAAPEGTIDPYVRLVSFWNKDTPLASLTYYASHPQSYYGRGGISADTVGLARAAREEAMPTVAHIHFNGAGGNIAAGKYNNGDTVNRQILADRLAAGMSAAWTATVRVPVSVADVDWTTRPLKLPIKKSITKEKWLAVLENPKSSQRNVLRAGRKLAWLKRNQEEEKPITVGCLKIGDLRVLHLPGELFVEYQIAAQAMRPDLQVCMAAYGDHGAGYLCTKVAYSQGGYEPGPPSNTAPEAEQVIKSVLRELLEVEQNASN